MGEDCGTRSLAKRLVAATFRVIFVFVAALLFAGDSFAVSARGEPTPAIIRLPEFKGSDLRFAHLSSGEGQSSYGRISSIVQDDQGFLWFGTNNGLQRYDGYTLRAFRHDPKNPKSLSGSYINALFKDRDGKLWVASDEYLERYDPITESFTRDPSLAGGIEGWVWQISQDREGTLWLATHAGLVRLDPNTWQTTRYRHTPNDPASLSSDVVTATFQQRDGTFWVATNDGLDVFDRHTGKVTQHIALPPHPPVSLQVEFIMNLFEDHTNTLWLIYSFGNGLAKVDRANHRLIEYAPSGKAASGSGPSGIRAIQEDTDGALWLGTVSGGILKLDASRQHFTRYRNDPRYPQSLSSDQVVALFADRDRDIWVGTTGGALDRFTYRQLPFQSFRHDAYNPNSLEINYTSAVLEDGQGNVWVGSIKVLTKIDRKAGRYTFFRNTGPPIGPSSLWIVSMAEDRFGSLWFGTLGGGLNRFDPRGEFKAYRHDPADPHSLSHDNVLSLFVGHNGTLWAGTEDGLSAFVPATGNFRVYRPQQAAWFRRYRAIAQDAKGTLWLGSLGGGLQRFDPATGQFTVYSQSDEGLSSNQVNAVCVDRFGFVWAGTQNGLDRLDPATGKFSVYYEHDGLPSNSIDSILQDDDGDLWMSTSNGLSRFDPSTTTFSNYYTSDGLPGNEFYNYANAYQGPGGQMFFNSYAGVVGFVPREIEEMDEPFMPPVVLTNFQLFSKPVPIGSASPLKQALSFTRSLVLSHSQDIFSFEFAALSYADPLRNRYRYRLEGLDKAWNDTDALHRTAAYTTLRPGNYTLRVQGRTDRGPWNQLGASLNIRILPPWWETWWFRMAVAIAIFLLLGAIYELRLRQVAAEFNLRLEERVAERLRIARDLHDTLLQSFHGVMLLFQRVRNLLPARPVEAMSALDDALLRADQAITEGREALRDLRTSTLLRNDLADAMTTLGEELADPSLDAAAPKFRVLVEGISRDLHPILRDEIYCIVREALRNAFHHAQARHIEVEITYAATLLRLRIRDDGVGIDQQVLNHGGREGHYGLRGMQERADRIGAQLRLWSRPGTGTELELRVPSAVAYRTSPEHPSGLLRKDTEQHHEP